MINLKFNSINIEGFQSIGQASIAFNNLGTCFIKGINNYDSKTKSNGSGKSSLLLSLYWCLFDKTPAGITNNVANKFYKNGCCVELNLNVDDVNYIIRRSINHNKYKTNLTILKDSEDISGRNKSDSNKLIKELIKIDEDIFSQMIFLSQGFNNRFAIYPPKARKELLESIYGVNDRLDKFVIKLKGKESTINSEIQLLNGKQIELKTKISLNEESLAKNDNSIKLLEYKINELVSSKSNITKEKLDELQDKINSLTIKKDALNKECLSKQLKLKEVDKDISFENNEIFNYKSEITKFKGNKICPTCGTILEDYSKNEHMQNHILELNTQIKKLEDSLDKHMMSKNLLQSELTEINSKLSSMQNKLDNFISNFNNKKVLYEKEIKKDTEITGYKNQIDTLMNEHKQLSLINDECKNELDIINNKLINKSNDLSIIQHSIRLANNQFKSYLLQNIINLLNEKLKELSESLFENEIIEINGDSKLDIILGDKIYEQLSGGEKTKIDIAIIIAQRHLAQQMNSISSNILVTDEIFDGLDDTSFGIILDILYNEIEDVESTFIISHRDIHEIPFDHCITVTKNKDQVSEVIIN